MAIELPRDANGQIIPLDTTMMFRDDRSQFRVTDFFYEARPNRWFARSGSMCIETNKLQLNIKKKNCYEQLMDDSWEKLIGDLDRAYHEPNNDEAICSYSNRARKQNGCKHCRFKYVDRTCDKCAILDIEFRICRLLGKSFDECEAKGIKTLYEQVEPEGDAK